MEAVPGSVLCETQIVLFSVSSLFDMQLRDPEISGNPSCRVADLSRSNRTQRCVT
jgi:hypothetical protein